MTTPRADKNAEKTPTRLTRYAIFVTTGAESPNQFPTWSSAADIDAHGAHHAIRKWASGQGADFAGGPVMAIPLRSLTVAHVTVETKRQLTLGTP